jgi:hypothetical protein
MSDANVAGHRQRHSGPEAAAPNDRHRGLLDGWDLVEDAFMPTRKERLSFSLSLSRTSSSRSEPAQKLDGSALVITIACASVMFAWHTSFSLRSE